ncbi:MAG: TolC family protein [Thermacetogeniaceae bacterium]
MRKLLTAALCALLIITSSLPAFAEGDSAETLSLKEAIDKAIAHSRVLRLAEYNIQLAQEDRDAAAEKVEYIPTGEATPEAEQAFNNLVQKDLDLQAAKKDYQAQKDSIVISVYQAYYGVLEAEATLDVAQKALDQADLEYRATSLKNQFGGASKYEVEQKQNNLEAAKQSYTAAEKALASAYEKLNQLVGLQPDERPVLTDKPVFSPLQIDSLDAEIARVLDASPTVWRAKEAITQAKIALDIYSYSSTEAHTYKGMEISVSKAEENAQAAKENAEQTVRSLYNSIQQLEANHAALERKLAAAEETLRMTELKYQYGRASRLELLAAQSAAASCRQALLNNECQHAILVQAFKTPWAYSGQ